MKSNIILLTNGLSGSSVITGFLSQAGYWTGDDTFKKKDYNTYENQDLVDINKSIFKQLNFDKNYEMIYDPEYFSFLDKQKDKLDPALFENFIETCSKNSPWIWKDPRLWLTIRLWKKYLPLESIKFIVLSREPMQTWISTTYRKQIQTYKYSKNYIDGTISSITDFLDENNLSYLQLIYEDLITKPEITIKKINDYLDTDLNIEDLKKVYTKPLYKKQRGKKDFLKASLIYAKNYTQRFK